MIGGQAEGAWKNNENDKQWLAPDMESFYHSMDQFHTPASPSLDMNRWAEWHYFNVLSQAGRRWAFVSFIVGGDVRGTKWGGQLGITLREQGGATRRFVATSSSDCLHPTITGVEVSVSGPVQLSRQCPRIWTMSCPS